MSSITFVDEIEEKGLRTVEVIMPGSQGRSDVANTQKVQQGRVLGGQLVGAAVGRAELGDHQPQLGTDVVKCAQNARRSRGLDHCAMEGDVAAGHPVPRLVVCRDGRGHGL
jgi:hypothetical protein